MLLLLIQLLQEHFGTEIQTDRHIEAAKSWFHPVGIDRFTFDVQNKRDLPAITFTVVSGSWVLHALMFQVAVPTLQ